MGARDSLFDDHLARLRAAVLEGDTLASIPRWITKNTKLKGQAFSFKDHEFQEQILLDPSPEKNIRKCSQVGASEMTVRACLAIAMVLEESTMIYTLPTADGAKKFTKQRVDPVIRSSPVLSAAINAVADNTEVKQLNSSFILFKGTVGQAAAITVPADGVFNDELDFSDPEIVSNYQSRLTHSPHKLRWKFSTPTVEGYGISAEMAVSRRFFNFVKCDHCNHQFLPDYFKHVRIPGFTDDLREVRKDNLWQIEDLRLAYVECPKCGGKPSLQHEHREWVCENSDRHYAASGYQVTPFEAPNVVTCADLIRASTSYKRYVDFINYGLGLPAEDKETTLTQAEIEACYITGVVPGFWSHVMGIDMGMICHIVISGVDAYGRMLTVKTEQIPLPRLVDRVLELQREYRVAMTVMDSLPYTETLIRMQVRDPNLFGAIYVRTKDLQPFTVKKVDAEKEEGQVQVRQVNVNRNKALDGLMSFIRAGNWQVLEDSNKPTFVKHLQDMKRVKDVTSENELAYVWRKSTQEEDHYHHALLYCWIASQMRGVVTGGILLPGLVHKFKQTAA